MSPESSGRSPFRPLFAVKLEFLTVLYLFCCHHQPKKGVYIISSIVWLLLDLYNNYVLWSYYITTP